jgi:predicted alpha/beta hydrolase family esterase
MKRVFIVHGWEADPNCNWFPWLKDELDKNGLVAQVPAMPNTNHPQALAWVDYLQELIGAPNEDIILVGHSLGAITILKYLNGLLEAEKIGGVILVAGSTQNPGFLELDGFFVEPLDFEKIKKTCDNFVVIHSDNDPVVPVEMGKAMSDNLQAEFILMPGLGHLNAGNGLFQLPIALEKIVKMAQK